MFPDTADVIADFENMVTWKKSSTGKRIPQPKYGTDQSFDRVDEALKAIKEEMEKHMKGLGYKNAKLIQSSGKFRYEIELDQSIKVDKSVMMVTQKNKGKVYYQTDEIKDLIVKLEDNEDDLKKELLPFIRAMFKKFYESRAVFANTAACVGELDCLCALAVVSA